jgi:CRP-like cAMP-binding protein
VESAQFSHDASHMFLLRSGQIVAGGDGRAPGEAGGSHAGFGELAMLGAEHKRPHTIRALTACFTLEVPRAAFVAAIAAHPGEKHHFERFAVQVLQDGGSDEKCRWPFLANAPARLLYLLNLYAGLTAFRSGHVLVGEGADAPKMSAVLVVAGEAAVMSAADGEIQVLREGDCYNVRELLGVPSDNSSFWLEARGVCEAQILPKEVWDRVIAEFPENEVQDVLKSEIISHLVSKAMTSRGIAAGPLELVRRVRLLGAASNQLATWLTEHLEPLMVMPGDNVMVEGQNASRMFILLDGKSRSEYSCGTFVFGPGKVFCEAALLGVVNHYLRTVTASTVCMLQSLDRKHFQDRSRWTEQDLQIMEPLLQEAQERKDSDIEADRFETRMRQKVVAFKNADHDFLVQLCENMEDKFMEPGEVIMAQGDECQPGVTPFYSLISGELVLENKAGVFMGHVMPGETFGESGALGFSQTRSLTVRATLAGCVHCVKIEGVACIAAIRRFPSQRAALETIIDQRWHQHAIGAKKRALWIRDKVVPVLRAHWLFADTTHEFVAELAVGLASAEYEAGKVIAKAGDAADSMLVLLEGTADVESKDGEVLGSLTAEATIGEVALMGLFPLRLATLRATTACCVLPVTEKALRRALAELSDSGARKSELALAQMAEQRRSQVQQGLPMTSLPLRVGQDNICVRAIALQARRISLAPNEIWECIPASHPGGPHFGVLASGRAVIEMRHEEDPSKRIKVLPLSPGDLLMEDVASEFGMELRATSACEVFRVRRIDFRTALARAPAAAEQWHPHFRMLEVEAVKVLRSRGQNVRGQLHHCQEHPNSEGIQLWKRRRDRAIARAPRKVLPAVLRSDSQPDLPISLLRKPIKMKGDVSAGRLPSISLSAPSLP